jgi:diguanylate cyclase (GGDEF)-like protein
MSTHLLLISRDPNLKDRLTQSLSDFAGGALTIESVHLVSDTVQRLRQTDGVDVVIMDWDLPATRGIETLRLLVCEAPELPIIVLGDDPHLLQQMNLVEHGAQEYLLKRCLDAATLTGTVHSAIARKARERHILRRRDGRELPIEGSAAPIRDRPGRVAGLVIVFHDVSEAQARMAHLAEHDILTALPNRGLLDDRLEQGIALAQRHSRRLAVLFIDLDHFKHINDSLGHLIGDQLLKAVSLRIRPCVRSSDTVSRQGGDEFIVLLSEIADAEDAALIADKIRLAVLEPYTIANHHLQLTASIGVSLYPEDGGDPETLIQCADTAKHHAKEKGRDRNQFFKEEMNLYAAERQIIRADLRHTLDRREFVLDYQPKVNLLSGAITGVEALIRWRHPSRGVLSPLGFIQIAEGCGLIVQIGQWVLRAACIQAQTWLADGVRFGTMAVNISAVEFRNDKFLGCVCDILESTGLEPRYLELELTETAVMRDFEATGVVLQSLSAMGIRIAVDDFGTGYSNLSYLKRSPINTLKLDKSFVHDIPENANMATIVRSVIHMGQSSHLTVVAEGVENAAQPKFLRAHDCAEGQGFYFSRPVDPTACQALISVGERRWAKQLSPTLRAFQ